MKLDFLNHDYSRSQGRSDHITTSCLSDLWEMSTPLCDRSDTAILYNDRSVLESHHVSAAYRLLQDDDEMNILYNLSKDDWRSVWLTRTDSKWKRDRQMERAEWQRWGMKLRYVMDQERPQVGRELITYSGGKVRWDFDYKVCYLNIMKVWYFLDLFISPHVEFPFQGAESSGGGDGVGHRYVVPLPAGEGHEELSPTTWGVSFTSFLSP